MKNFQFVEFLTQGHDHAEVVTYNTLGDLVPAKPTVLLSKEHGPRILVGPSLAGAQASDPLTLNAYQDYAFDEAIYFDHGKGTRGSISMALTGLSGEIGSAVKQWHEIMCGLKPLTDEAKDGQRVALAHAFWFFAATAKELNVTLSELGAQSIRQARAWRRERELADRQQALPRSGKLASAGDL